MEFLELRKRVMDSPQFLSRPHLWHYCIEQIKPGDVCLEFGVWNGRSINYMADARPNAYFHGFDSFEGLPEAWITGHDAGHFKTDRSKLKFLPNITIHEGWFDQTIPAFLSTPSQAGPVRFLHIDCDLGSSTTTVLEGLRSTILTEKPLILFDEFYNYNGYEDHEFLAFLNFVNDTMEGLRFDVVGRNVKHQQVAIQML